MTETDSTISQNGEFERWSQLFATPDFYYGTAPGPVARRAVRYHRPLQTRGGRALDAGSGEGQDTVFLAESDYDVTAIEWTSEGVAKSRRLLQQNHLEATLVQADLRLWNTQERFDLLICINSLQFLGSQAPATLEKLKSMVAPGGVIGISVFGRENAEENPFDGVIYRWTLDELMANFSGWQPFEAARLWQWGPQGPQPFVTLIAANFSDRL